MRASSQKARERSCPLSSLGECIQAILGTEKKVGKFQPGKPGSGAWLSPGSALHGWRSSVSSRLCWRGTGPSGCHPVAPTQALHPNWIGAPRGSALQRASVNSITLPLTLSTPRAPQLPHLRALDPVIGAHRSRTFFDPKLLSGSTPGGNRMRYLVHLITSSAALLSK
jgi:hypothetical protein